jgi:hypothetical protein
LYNLTNGPVTLGGLELPRSAQPLLCVNPLPKAAADQYFLVPACLASAAHARADIVWSGSMPHCSQCAPVAKKGHWYSNLANKQKTATHLHVIEHYTHDEGRQAVGVEFFRQQYLQ